MKKLLFFVLMICFAASLGYAEEKPGMIKEGRHYTDQEESGEKELDLGEPTEEEISEMTRESEWRDEEENTCPEFDGEREGSTRWMQDF